MKFEQRLEELQITLPEVVPAGNYLPAVRSGRQVYVSGQLPRADGRLAYIGRVGHELSLEEGRRAARLCVINALAALRFELRSLDKVNRVLRLNGYILSGVGFREQHKVLDGASELLIDVFGPSGRHARSAVGVVELPLGSAVEIDLTVEAKG